MYLVVLIIDETFKSQESMKKLFVSCSCFLVTALLSVQADNKMDKQTDIVCHKIPVRQSPIKIIGSGSLYITTYTQCRTPFTIYQQKTRGSRVLEMQ